MPNSPSSPPLGISLIQQAKNERLLAIEVRRKNSKQQEEYGIGKAHEILNRLKNEGVNTIWTTSNDKKVYTIILSSTDSLSMFLSDILSSLTSNGVIITHLETRKKSHVLAIHSNDIGYDILAECESDKDELIKAVTLLTQIHNNLNKLILCRQEHQEEVPWFPRHISDLDKCSNCSTKYEPTSDKRHPGHGDLAYIARRQFLNDQTKDYRHGDPLPIVEYTEEEHRTWTFVYEELREIHKSLACRAYRDNIKLLEDEGVITQKRIPQLKDINEYLRKRTGFTLRPCSGLLSARDFLASLAFRVFQTTTYLRRSKNPQHSPEPDLIHELLGHVPMFADPILAQMSQDIGLMSLGATDEQIEKLSTVYWFIIEFGLCREDGKLKAIGAGLLSAYGELIHACSDIPEHVDFDPSFTALQSYEDSDYQQLYFVAESILDALNKLRQYAGSMNRSFSVVYDPYTQSVEIINETSDLDTAFSRFRVQFTAISSAVERIKRRK